MWHSLSTNGVAWVAQDEALAPYTKVETTFILSCDLEVNICVAVLGTLIACFEMHTASLSVFSL